jgi:hypothetical protein
MHNFAQKEKIMDTKLSAIKQAAAKNHWRKAIAIAAKFPQLGEQRNAILDAHLAFTNPRWIAGLGKDIDACIDGGVAALRARYGL